MIKIIESFFAKITKSIKTAISYKEIMQYFYILLKLISDMKEKNYLMKEILSTFLKNSV